MRKKSVLRRMSKRLPSSADLDNVIRADDDMFELNTELPQVTGHSPAPVVADPQRPNSLKAMLGAPANQEPKQEPKKVETVSKEPVQESPAKKSEPANYEDIPI
jgi:recombinational DNA repair protein RecT